MPEHAGRIIMIIKIQLAACFLEHIRRRPGMFPIGRIDNPVQFPAPAMGNHGPHQIHFKTDTVGKIRVFFVPPAPLDIGIIQHHRRNMVIISDFGNGAFSTGIDKTDAVVIEGKAQCRTE